MISGPIERGIPLPQKTRGRPVLYKIEDMGVGDSRYFAAPYATVRSAIWARSRKLGYSMTCAPDGDGSRVWRVK